MSAPYIQKRRSRWYVRARVPSDLTAILGCEMIRTLSTSDYDVARRRASGAMAEIQKYFGEVRRLMSDENGVIEDEDETPVVSARVRKMADLSKLTGPARRTLETRLMDQLYVSPEEAAYETDQIILGKNTRISDQSKQIGELTKNVEALTTTVRLVAGGGAVPSPSRLPPNAKGDEALRPWSDFKDGFFAYQAPGKSARESYDLAFRRFEKVVGHKAIAEISMEDVQGYRDEVAAAAKPREGRAAASAANIQKMLSHIKTFMSWAAGDGLLIKESPADNVGVTPGQRQAGASESRQPYSAEMLEKIFNAPLFTGCLSRERRYQPGRVVLRDHKFWFPLVALFTGGRENELQQLTPADVRMEEGHLCFRIAIIAAADDDTYDDVADPARRNQLKTENAPRIIPVHPTLKKLGFLDFVEKRKRERAKLLFDSYDYGKFWNQGFLPSIGIKRPGITMYSFRHTYKRALRTFKSDETKNRLMGHAPASVGELYGGGLDGREAKLFCDFFEVPVDLSHLYPLVK